MLNHLVAREALRTRLLTFVSATTGTMALAATTTGFTRATGSFEDDGFKVGMEVVPAGFTNNAVAIVQKVEPLTLTIVGSRTAQASGAGRSLTVGLPVTRHWMGTQTPETVGIATRPRLLEQWVPGVTRDYGAMIDTGFYVITWQGLANYGIAAMLTQMQDLRDLFPPGYAVFIGDDQLRVTGDPAPSFTTPVTTENGYLMSTLSIPWRAVTTNLDAA